MTDPAADTAISFIDGAAGRFVVRGIDIEALTCKPSFEAMCHLLWMGEPGTAAQIEAIRASLAVARDDAYHLLPTAAQALALPDATDALRAALELLPLRDDQDSQPSQIAGAVPVFAAAWHRLRQDRRPLAPRRELCHCDDYLQMLGRPELHRTQRTAFETYLVTMAEHDFMASTFVARIVASTGSDRLSAVIAALGALKGAAHGGAPAPILEMIRAVGSPERAEQWVREQMRKGGRIMGMGHRVYRVRDPRAGIIEQALERIEASAIGVPGLAIAHAIERSASKALNESRTGRRVEANVELYAAVLLDHVGLPPAAFTVTYAMACVAGWLAHYREQADTKHLIRPLSNYVGPKPDVG